MNLKRRIRRRICICALIGVLMILVLFIQFSVGPMVGALAKARVENRASYIINEAIEAQLRSEDIDYENIVFLEKNVNGSITALKTNINEINRLKTQTLSVIDTMLLDLDVNEIGLPLGSLILPELFSGVGPKLPIKVLSISASDADFRNEFSAAGINQTSHRITMDVTITMTVLTPIGTESVTVTSGMVVAETVIVGSVPESYVNVKPTAVGE